MHFSVIYTHALWLLLLLPLLWLFTLTAEAASTRPLASAAAPAGRLRGVLRLLTSMRRRVWVALILRTLLFVVLILALAGAQLIRPVENLTVVFLIDGSDSVTPAQRQWALNYMNDALDEQEPDDKAAIVVFGENALVERVPISLRQQTRLTSTPVGSRTNIADAIQLGLALFPADTQKRLVILSDGEENAGRATEAARIASVRDIHIDVLPMPEESGHDVLVSALDAPDTARQGQRLTLETHIQSSVDTSGQLQFFADDELIATQEVDIKNGNTTIPLTIPDSQPGFHRYEVRLEAQEDTQGINNRAAAFTSVEGPPTVLLVATAEDTAAPLKRVLEATDAQVEVRPPDGVPSEQAQLRQYAAVILVDVRAYDVPRSVQEALPIYVREQGGSLSMIGGRNSFGAGGWRRSPLAEVLPVELERRDTQQRPDLALVLVLDRSGSMSESGGTGLTKLDLAKEAVYQSTLGLENNDQIGVVAFDDVASWVLPVQPLPQTVQIAEALSQFIANGGTNIRSGIEPAANALAGTDAKVKHVILLTDGQATSNYSDLIAQMNNNGVTITVVSIGRGANPELRQIAELGGGRYYQVNTLSDVPRIFLSETVIVAGRDIVEGQFTPMVALPAPIVRGWEDIPPLYGYNATQPRLAARTVLVSPDSKPILAQWQYGLGSSVAWTSDLKGQWARDWLSWERFPSFGSDLLDMMLPPKRTEGLALETRTEEDRAILELDVQQDGRPLEDVAIQGRLLDPDDSASSLSFDQVGAGRYRAVVPVADPGVYLAQVAVLDSEGKAVGNVSSGLVVAYSPEYRTQRSTPHLLSDLAAITGGRTAPQAAAIYESPPQEVGSIQEIAVPLVWLALVLLPLDIATRRVLMRWRDVQPIGEQIRGLFRRKPAPQASEMDATMARLRAARDRARRERGGE